VLAPEIGENVGDLCAAPGGKALLLAEALAAGGDLLLNDRSRARLGRLRRVVTDYLPAALRERVRLTNHDATRFGLRHRNSFDALLLDVPCSSERHVLGNPRALGEWSLARVRRLAQQQYAILAAAAAALKPGGRLVYSTCALAPDENDGAIERIVASRKHDLVVARPAGFTTEVRPDASPPEVEATRLGFQILPDRCGAGPLYFALLRKPG
jgi:16S rRNA C967 or C1407 C5-methylase (RsmB/RsmF family)